MNTIWFDLEGTLIDSMDNPLELINREKVKFLLDAYSDYEIGIFSFALWDENDIHNFDNNSKVIIEAAYNIHISHIPTKRKMFETIKEFKQIGIDFMDFNDIWTKEQAFLDYIRATSDSKNILVDDVVENSCHFFNKCSINLINIGGVKIKKILIPTGKINK